MKYLGYILTEAGNQADTDKLGVTQNMAEPKSAAGVQRFLGIVTYLGKFIPQLTGATEPLRTLLKCESFTIDDELLAAFNKVKQTVARSLHTLAYFNHHWTLQRQSVVMLPHLV